MNPDSRVLGVGDLRAETAPAPLSFTESVLSADLLETLEIPSRENLVGTWWRSGAQGFLFGPRGLGKTWLAFHLARCLAEGRDCGPWKIPKARRVLYVDGEMPLDGLRERDRSLRAQTGAPLFVLSHERHFHQTGKGLNFTESAAQRALTDLCEKNAVEVLFLDNLSCLFTGMQENVADDWEAVLPWLLDLRRRGIGVGIVHHSGRAGTHMRGTSKREDASAWVLSLTAPSLGDERQGARFISRFTKNREGEEVEAGPWLWNFTTDDKKTRVSYCKMDHQDILVQLVRDGVSSCTDIAEEMGVSKGAVSKWAKRACERKLITIGQGGYKPV